MTRQKWVAVIAAGVVVLGSSGPLAAQIFRWVDEQGVTHYSTTPPPQTAERERRELDRAGQERRVIGGAGPVEDREAQAQAREMARLEEEQRRQEQARAQQLRMLYENEADIMAQRDRRLALLANNLTLSESQMVLLQREHARIGVQLENAEKRGDARNIERHQNELADLEQRIQREEAHQARQQSMKADIEANAATDLEDYRRLVLNSDD